MTKTNFLFKETKLFQTRRREADIQTDSQLGEILIQTGSRADRKANRQTVET